MIDYLTLFYPILGFKKKDKKSKNCWLLQNRISIPLTLARGENQSVIFLSSHNLGKLSSRIQKIPIEANISSAATPALALCKSTYLTAIIAVLNKVRVQ